MTTHPLDFASTGQLSPPKTPFSGTHFSDNQISDGVLHGARRGSSPHASDAHRIHLGGGAPSGSHVYRKGAVAHPSIGGRKHAYGVSGDKAIADISGDPVARKVFGDALTQTYKDAISQGTDPQIAKYVAQNAGEKALLDSGYDGYSADATHRGSVFLFGDTKLDSNGASKSEKTSPSNSVSV